VSAVASAKAEAQAKRRATAGLRTSFRTSISSLYLLLSRLMFHVYILRSLSNHSQIYIGFSSVDMPTRLERHNAGSTPATARYVPWEIAWHCTFPEKQRAMDFKAYLKSGSGRAFLHKRLT
jgi:putative endonuclease